MTSIIGKIFGIKPPDTSAQERQIEEQRKQIEADKKAAQDEARDEAEARAARRQAQLRGGKRMLLAETRDDAELGVVTKSTTLGSKATP